jgi:hypothetical protein
MREIGIFGKALFLISSREEEGVFFFKILIFIFIEKVIITGRRAAFFIIRGNYTSFIGRFWLSNIFRFFA